MKYYRHSRRRKSTIYGYNPKSKKKSDYMINTRRSRVLESGYYDNKVWGALRKAWKGYTIAKNKDEYDKMEHYARIIQECQYDLGRPISSFDNIGMSDSSFLWELVQKDNDSQEQQVSEEEGEEVDQQYEQERFSDAYSEYFEDDENKADRFTDTYRENFTD